MNSILWINISTAIVSINYDSYKYLGIYNINSDVLDEKRIDGYEYKFINTIKL